MAKKFLLLMFLLGCSNSKNDKNTSNTDENKRSSKEDILKKNKHLIDKNGEINSTNIGKLIEEYYEFYKDEKSTFTKENENKFIVNLKEKLIEGEEFSTDNEFIWDTILSFKDIELIELILNSFKNSDNLEKSYSQMINVIKILDTNLSNQESMFIKALERFVEKAPSVDFMLNKHIDAYIDSEKFRGNILELALYIKHESLIIKLLEKKILLSLYNIDKIINLNKQNLIEVLIKNYSLEQLFEGKIVNRKQLIKNILEKRMEIGYTQALEIFKTDNKELIEILMKNYKFDGVFEGNLVDKKELIKEVLKRGIVPLYEQAFRLIKMDDKEISELLLKNYSKNAFNLIAQSIERNDKDAFRKILSRLKHISTLSLIRIISTDDIELVEILLNAKFDINNTFEVVENGKNEIYTLVEYSTIKRYNKVALYLLDRKAEIYVEGTSFNLPFLAVYYRNIEVVEYLVNQRRVKFDKILNSANRSLLDLIKDEKLKLENEIRINKNSKKSLEDEKKIKEYSLIIDLIEKNKN